MKKTRSYYFSDGQLYELLERKLNSTFKLLTLLVKTIFNLYKLLNMSRGESSVDKRERSSCQRKIFNGPGGHLM